jgi:capsular exopolysaccharide synthesis family protein
MSRIDEAWRRASGQAVAEGPRRQPPDVSALDGPATDEPILARYVGEQTAQAGRLAPAPRERTHAAFVSARGSNAAARPTAPAALRGKLVVTPEIEPLSIEQYRRLAAALHELQAERALKSLMVSSTLPCEGKSLTITNLALTLSESYKRRILLIDADFHRPSIHEMFGISNEVGLADALRAADARVPLVQVSATLSVLPAGRVEENPIASLSSDRLRTVVSDATARFDWVLVDTPPVGMLTDAQLVSRATDGVLLVIAAGMTPYTLVQRSIAEIGIDRMVGTVLNRVAEHALPVRDYYRRQYADWS